MIESKRQEVIGLSPLPAILVHCAEVLCPAHRKPLKLTISVEKIDRFLADIRKQINTLQREMADLRLVRTQLARYEQENRGNKVSQL